jgi:carbohydrate-binding DOMON domain-containing protein
MSASSTPPTTGGAINRTLVATYDNNTQVATAQIPAQHYITAYDPSDNRGTNDYSGSYFGYTVSQSSQPIPWTYFEIGLGVVVVLSGILVLARRRK